MNHLEETRAFQAEQNQKMEEQLRQLQLRKPDAAISKGTTKPEYLWIIGSQPGISHRKLISYGGFGEVHEVLPLMH